jgi:hypothetical protein
VKKTDTSSRLQQSKDKQHHGTRQCPQKTFKEEILQVITENFMEMFLDMVNQNIQEAIRNFKTPKTKNTRRHRNK